MLCVRNFVRSCISLPVRSISKANYSRRSNENTSSYEIIKSNGESVDDFDNAVFEANPNWELLTPRGFRFYLPGSIGPGWLDSSTIAHIETHSMVFPDEEAIFDELTRNNRKKHNRENVHSILQCVAQECPLLLRKDIGELFPGCLEVNSPQLTIVTLSQNVYPRTARWSKEVEIEKLAKYFVLAASDVCSKLKMVGYWADFINPFSGQPYHNPLKNNTLYTTDERFRCLGFKIDQKNNCKVISHDDNAKNFVVDSGCRYDLHGKRHLGPYALTPIILKSIYNSTIEYIVSERAYIRYQYRVAVSNSENTYVVFSFDS